MHNNINTCRVADDFRMKYYFPPILHYCNTAILLFLSYYYALYKYTTRQFMISARGESFAHLFCHPSFVPDKNNMPGSTKSFFFLNATVLSRMVDDWWAGYCLQ